MTQRYLFRPDELRRLLKGGPPRRHEDLPVEELPEGAILMRVEADDSDDWDPDDLDLDDLDPDDQDAGPRPPEEFRHLDVSDLPDDAILMKMEEVEDLEGQDQDDDEEPDEDEDEDPDALAKERPHKYIKREPTGNAQRKWRYYYYVPGHGVVTSDGLKEGSRYAGKHEHEGVTHEGHFEVLQHHADTGHVTVRHTGSGQEQKLKHTEFADLVNRQHAAAHSSRKAQKIQEIQDAVEGLRQRPQDDSQRRRVERLVHRATEEGWLAPDAAQRLLRGEHEGRTRPPRPEAPPARRGKQGVQDGGLGLRGRDETIFVSDASGAPREQEARYRLIEAHELITSHDSRNFAPVAAYPAGVQERPYDKSKFAQLEVIRHARQLEPRLVINDNPDAAHGPPIMTPSGLALGGNSRGMSLQIAYRDYPEAADRYKARLTERAEDFGFSPEDVAGMQQPILVREVDEPANQQEAAALVRRYNESFTREMDPRSDQIARAKRVGSRTLAVLRDSLGTEETFNDFLDSPRSKELIAALMHEGVLDMRNVDRYVSQKGNRKDLLNEEGKALVGKLLLGRVVDDADVLEGIGQANRDKLIANIPHILRAGEASAAFDLRRAVKTAAAALAEMKARRLQVPSDLLSNREMVDRSGQAAAGDHPVFQDHLSRAVLAALWSKGQSELGPAFRKYAELAEKNKASNESDLFGGSETNQDETARRAIHRAFEFTTDDPIREVEQDKEEEARLRAQLKAEKARRRAAAAKEAP